MATKAAIEDKGKEPRPEIPPPAAKIHWNTQGLKSSYANFCNATSSREEVVLNFGVSNNWDRAPREMEVDLAHRIVLSPFAAKRLLGVLTKLVGEYESRYGQLK